MSLANASVGPVIAVSDLEAARHFYEQTLGLSAEETPGGVLVRAGGDTARICSANPMMPVAPSSKATWRSHGCATSTATC